MTLTTEQRHIVTQIYKHVSKGLAIEVEQYFLAGKDIDDLKYLVVKAAEGRKADAALKTWKEAWAAR